MVIAGTHGRGYKVLDVAAIRLCKSNKKTDIIVICFMIEKLKELIEAVEPDTPAIANLNYDYQTSPDTGRTSVSLNGLLVAVVSRTDTEGLFIVNMVNISTEKTEIQGKHSVKSWIDRQVTKWLFGCYAKII